MYNSAKKISLIFAVIGLLSKAPKIVFKYRKDYKYLCCDCNIRY